MEYNNSQIILVAAALLLVLLAALDQNIRSNILVLVLIVVVALMALMPMNLEPGKREDVKLKRHQPPQLGGKLDRKEKKLLIYHILSQLDKSKSLDMSELAGELNVGIYELTSIVRLLGKHQAVSIIYPPMHHFPILRKGDPNQSKKFRLKIYGELTKKSLIGEPKLEEFAKEVEDYLETMKRRPAGGY